ncbi:vegetative cell wall protein gp1-like [Catharus ustulatus]|uniref:vegetative cell wall protein gp1-like n=1 Tax=Catharus ustulatus TaxID=91951 RepID=UPI00140B059D|nr:vegetative cell wall protein gp1-like [Catharus ustulatus]
MSAYLEYRQVLGDWLILAFLSPAAWAELGGSVAAVWTRSASSSPAPLSPPHPLSLPCSPRPSRCHRPAAAAPGPRSARRAPPRPAPGAPGRAGHRVAPLAWFPRPLCSAERRRPRSAGGRLVSFRLCVQKRWAQKHLPLLDSLPPPDTPPSHSPTPGAGLSAGDAALPPLRSRWLREKNTNSQPLSRAAQIWSLEPRKAPPDPPRPSRDPRPWSPEPPALPPNAESSRCCCCRRLHRDTAQRDPLRHHPVCRHTVRRDSPCRDTSHRALPRAAPLYRDPPQRCPQPPRRRPGWGGVGSRGSPRSPPGCCCPCRGGCDMRRGL